MTIKETVTMVQTVLQAELGRLRTRRRPPDDVLRHRLLFIEPLQAVVMPYARAGGDGDWLCVVVAAQAGAARRTGHVVLTGPQLADAPGHLILDVDDHDGLALLLWPTWVFLRWPGGAFPVLARVLTERLRVPGTLHIPAEAVAGHGWLAARVSNLRPPGVARALDRLHQARFLAANPTGGLTLTVPVMPPGPAETSNVGPQ